MVRKRNAYLQNWAYCICAILHFLKFSRTYVSISLVAKGALLNWIEFVSSSIWSTVRWLQCGHFYLRSDLESPTVQSGTWFISLYPNSTLFRDESSSPKEDPTKDHLDYSTYHGNRPSIILFMNSWINNRLAQYHCVDEEEWMYIKLDSWILLIISYYYSIMGVKTGIFCIQLLYCSYTGSLYYY